MQPALQEITNRINQVNNILVTVKASPSVDELAAALGLTMALNNYGKHATAVFSGQIPNAMSFLKPQKTFENNVHSLRDFIISLNKEKADKLRFAKDGEIVKIYITPYKSTITPNDLAYSEGDFNVQMVIAVGINTKEELDTVIAAHGRILHEATVATVVAGLTPSQLGSINWSDPTLSSASAMALELLQSLNNPSLISPEVSTALLTGIVADTDRFSNPKTSPKVMELSAQLMNSGADHQLVTSSIGAASTSISTGSSPLAPNSATDINTDGKQELVLDLHSQMPNANTNPNSDFNPASTPNAAEPASASATNTSPMLSTLPEPASTKLGTESSAPLTPLETLSPINQQSTPPSLSEPVAQLLPQPVDPSQTVLPADLLPPQSPASSLSTNPVPSSTPLDTSDSQPANPTMKSTVESAVDQSPILKETTVSNDLQNQENKIKSEIDEIYSQEPFSPANNPRQDLGTDIVLPTEEHIQDIGAPALSVDTTVQQTQASPSLKPIEAIKNESVAASDMFGSETNSTDQQVVPYIDSTSTKIPGLEMPPEITLPPPPPNPLSPSRASALDTAPFGSTLNFDPTKPADNAA